MRSLARGAWSTTTALFLVGTVAAAAAAVTTAPPTLSVGSDTDGFQAKQLRAGGHAVVEKPPSNPVPWSEPKLDLPIVTANQRRRWWGFPNYGHGEAAGLRSWSEFAHEHGHLGVTCARETARERCSTAFICKDGACVECEVSRDCGEHFKCEEGTYGRRLCIPRDLQKQWHWGEVICTILICLTAILSAAAGMGGGGVYVPLLLLVLGLSTKEAVPLSQAMIVGGATVNVFMFCGQRHPNYPRRPKIDYDVIMMMNPGLAGGVTLGVMAHLISPQWLIVFVLLVTLVISLHKTLTKGLQQWKKESKMLENPACQVTPRPSGSDGEKVNLKLVDFPAFMQLAEGNMTPLVLIAGCWLGTFMLNLMKAPQCSTVYWLQLLGMLAIFGAFTFAGAKVITGRPVGSEKADGLLAWTPRNLWLYPLLSAVAGFLGGFLGIGGGIIMAPLLLELGMIPEANQATTAMFVFLSSSLATIQFVVLGKAMPQFVFWFTTWVLMSTLVGQILTDFILRRWRRSSLIVLSIAGIIFGSLIMMTCVGMAEVVADIRRGADMGVKPYRLCGG